MDFDENPQIFVEKKNYDSLDEELIKKLKNNEINVDDVVRNLEKLYKGN